MNLFEWLIVAHLVGDWILQTEYEALNKAKGRFFNKALIKHCVTYTLAYVPVLLLLGVELWWLVWIFVTHMIVDRRWLVEWILHTVKATSDRTIKDVPILPMAVDQIIHVLVLVPIVLVNS